SSPRSLGSSTAFLLRRSSRMGGTRTGGGTGGEAGRQPRVRRRRSWGSEVRSGAAGAGQRECHGLARPSGRARNRGVRLAPSAGKPVHDGEAVFVLLRNL